jgi:hypothetical protein
METTNTDKAQKKAAKAAHAAMVARIEALFSSPDPKKRRETVERAIIVLYARQTADEQNTDETRHNNGVGFTAADARRLSFVAKFLSNGGHLRDEKVLQYVPRVAKYTKQLATIALEKKGA